MSDSIREQLLQMGLVSAEQARKTERAPRRKGKGRRTGGADARDGATSATVSPPEAADGPVDRAAVTAEIAAGRIADVQGRKRFYVTARGGRLPYLDVSDAIIDRLARGSAAVCERPDGALAVVDGEAAERVRALDPSAVRTGPPTR